MVSDEQKIIDARRKETIALCMDILGRHWKEWGLEIITATDKFLASKTYDPSKGVVGPYLWKTLMNEINKTRAKNKPMLQLFDGYDVGYEIPALVSLMKVDVQKAMGNDTYLIVLDKYGYGFSVKDTAFRNKVTVETVRWRLKQFDDYCKGYVND